MSEESRKPDGSQEYHQQPQHKKPRGRAIFLAFLIGLVCGIVLMVWKPWSSKKDDSAQKVEEIAPESADEAFAIEDEEDHTKTVVSISYLKQITSSASDLVTTKYYYQDADTYENTKQLFGKNVPLTTDEFIYTYEGTISLGIDVSDIGFSVDNDNQTVEVDLPDIKIIANEIDADSFEFYTAKNSIFNQTDLEDATTLIGELKEKKAEKVMADEDLLKDAESRTETVIKELIENSELAKDYSITFS